MSTRETVVTGPGPAPDLAACIAALQSVVKYGSLSAPSGRVTVRPRVMGAGERARLSVDDSPHRPACRMDLPLKALEPSE